MKKSYKLILSLTLLLPVFTGFAQDYLIRSKLPPALGAAGSRFSVTATVMDNDTWCRVTWPDPIGYPWELAYDDGEADDFFVYSNPGSLNANKFIPQFHPYIVTGGSIYVGNGSFPGPFLGTSFRVLVFDDDGEGGLPGTALDSIDVTVENYDWVEFEGLTAEISEGNFYLAMKQLAPAPDAAPVGVDTDNPTYSRSYSYFQGNPGWILSPLQDLMIRAFITGYNEPSRTIDSFEVARFSGFEYNESPFAGDTTVLDTITASEYNDYGWGELDEGLYTYGIKTHFSGGQWSDYDLSNLITHIFYPFPPACFYQSVSGNQELVICPPADLNGTLPNYFTGFNLYVDGAFYALLPPSSTSYTLDLPGPAIYSCMLTAVYEPSLHGNPEEVTESIPLSADYKVRFGYPLPFLEQWNTGTFETNNWLPESQNWSVNGNVGNPSPSAEFTWDPIQSDYQVALESYPLLADSITEGQIYLDFDIKLDNVNATGNEQMLLQVWNWESQEWGTVSTYSNADGSFDWASEHVDITDQAMGTVFKIRFLASGENSINILSWFVDNISVYRECKPPLNLITDWSFSSDVIVLNWDNPEGSLVNQWIHWDDGANNNSIGIPTGDYIDVASRWEPDQLTDFEGATIEQIAFFPTENTSDYHVKVWIGENATTLVLDQQVESPAIGEWNEINIIPPLPINIDEELWIGYTFYGTSGTPAGVDDGPAIDGFGNLIRVDGGPWETLLNINPTLDYNWNISAYIHLDTNETGLDRFAIYRSDDGSPYFLRAYSYQNMYIDDSICFDEVPAIFFNYKVSALYLSETDFCESDYSNEASEICEGVNEIPGESNLKIYPNPASDVLFIESEEKIESITIFDSRGITIEQLNNGTLEQWNNGTLKIPVGGLAPGLYLVKVETGGAMIVRKVVVRR